MSSIAYTSLPAKLQGAAVDVIMANTSEIVANDPKNAKAPDGKIATASVDQADAYVAKIEGNLPVDGTNFVTVPTKPFAENMQALRAFMHANGIAEITGIPLDFGNTPPVSSVIIAAVEALFASQK